jgi:Uncharacterised protein family UPF0564
MELKYGKEAKNEHSKSFRLPSPKEVPNFKNLQKTFEIMLENKRRCVKPTIPSSPNFHKSKVKLLSVFNNPIPYIRGRLKLSF